MTRGLPNEQLSEALRTALRGLSNSFPRPFEKLSEAFRTAFRGLPNCFPGPSKQLSEAFRTTFRDLPNSFPRLSKQFSEAFRTTFFNRNDSLVAPNSLLCYFILAFNFEDTIFDRTADALKTLKGQCHLFLSSLSKHKKRTSKNWPTIRCYNPFPSRSFVAKIQFECTGLLVTTHMFWLSTH